MPAFNLREVSAMELPQSVTAHPANTLPIPVDLIAIASICLFLTTFALCARVFTKAVDLKHFQIDDYAILLAAAGSVSFIALFFEAARAGQGSHIWNVSSEALKRVYLFSNAMSIVYAPTMFFAKFAVLVQVGRIFSGIKKRIIYWGVRILIALNLLCYTAILFARIFACMPRAKISDPSVPGKCISQSAGFITTSTVNVASDVAMLLFPLWGVSKLHLPLKRTLLVSVVFGIGLFTCAASSLRLYYGVKVDADPDFTKAIWPVNMWTLIELNSIIIIACCPTFPRLVHYIQGKTLKRKSYSTAHVKWISSSTAHSDIPGVSSKSQILYPAATRSTGMLSEGGSGEEEGVGGGKGVPNEFSTARSVSPFEPFEPFERPISHLSYDSYLAAPISEVSGLSEERETASPVSPARTEFSTVQVGNATEMSVTPVYFATIRKTVDVRISNHTNPGSPVVFGKPEADW